MFFFASQLLDLPLFSCILYTLWIQTLYHDTCFANIFSHSVAGVLIFFMVYFGKPNLIWWSPNLLCFSFTVHALCVGSKKSHVTWGHTDLLLQLFMDLVLTLRSMILFCDLNVFNSGHVVFSLMSSSRVQLWHICLALWSIWTELIFAYSVRSALRFLFLPTDADFVQHHLMKRLFSIDYLGNQVSMWWSISGFSVLFH